MMNENVFSNRLEELICRYYNTIDFSNVDQEKKCKLRFEIEKFLISDLNKMDFTLKLIPIKLPSIDFIHFQRDISYAHGEFFSKLFRRNDFKYLFKTQYSDILISPMECLSMAESLSCPIEISDFSQVFYFFTECMHSCMIFVTNNKQGLIGQPISAIVYDSINAISLVSIRNFLALIYTKAKHKDSKIFRVNLKEQKGNSCAILALTFYLLISHREFENDIFNEIEFQAQEGTIFQLFFEITIQAKKVSILQKIADIYNEIKVPMPSTEKVFFMRNAKKSNFLRAIAKMVKSCLRIQ